MSLRLPISAVFSRQGFMVPYAGWKYPPTITSNIQAQDCWAQILIVHTGQLVFQHPVADPFNPLSIPTSALTNVDVFSFLPYPNGEVQIYDAPFAAPQSEQKPFTLRHFDVAATASLASFENVGSGANSLAAVDGFEAKLVPLNAGETTGPHVLILKVNVAARQSQIYRVSYQVTAKLASFTIDGQPPDLPKHTDATYRFTPPASLLPPTW